MVTEKRSEANPASPEERPAGAEPPELAQAQRLQANASRVSEKVETARQKAAERARKLHGTDSLPPVGAERPSDPTLATHGETSDNETTEVDEKRGRLTEAGKEEQLAAAYRQATAEVDVARERMAARLQPHLNAFVKTMPQETYADKHTVAKWVNAQLRPRGLALKCPNTGAASLLQVDTGDYPDIGRFQFYHLEEGKQDRSASRTKLPDLEVIPADLGLSPQEEQDAGWAAGERRRRATKTREKS